MQDLRLVGVHDDGEHLLLSGAGGEMFQLPINEALRLAASRPSLRKQASAVTALSPRDIQARIRSGATAAEVAEASGLPLEKVERYEGPVLAEREYIAQQARKVEVASPAPGHDIYRSAFGDNPATLGDMVGHRLAAHGISSSTLEWDSWRRPDGTWTVVARFETQPGNPVTIGEEPPAMWTFNPSRKSLQNANRWAQQLSELEPLDGPVPARRLSAVSDRPFDFETDAETAARNSADQQKDADGLLDMLRSRRGQRLGLDEDSDDALALLLANGVPAAHPRPEEAAPVLAPDEDEPADDEAAGDKTDSPAAEHTAAPRGPAPAGPATHGPATRRRDARPSMVSRLSLAPQHQSFSGGPEDDSLQLHNGVSTDTREITIVPAPLRPVGNEGPAGSAGLAGPVGGADTDSTGIQDTPGARPADRPLERPAGASAASNAGLDELLGRGTPRRRLDAGRAAADQGTAGRQHQDRDEPERQPARPKRSSVPSWDEIVFGTRGD
ncbi:septation protein SepH [Arthrobacter sp. D1-17]